MVSTGKGKITREEVEKTRLWKEVNASSSDEEVSEPEEGAGPSRKRAGTPQSDAPQKRRKGLESDSKDSSVEQETGKGGQRKRKNRDVEDTSDEQYSLIDVIKHHGKLVSQAVKNWVERYDSTPGAAICELLMTIFEACGAKFEMQEELLDKYDVDEVVVELVNQAKAGDVEDYLSSKQKELRGFKDNLVAFWDAFVLECQSGPVFDEKLMDPCINFITALACTPPRIFRHVATLIGLQIATSFVGIAKTLSESRETKQRQLIAEEKKKRKDASRIASLNKVLSETHDKITKIEEMIQQIVRGLFMHRYRDVDLDIRVACVKAIGRWIVSYPSYFLTDMYLKYLGWTLSDKVVAVRKSSIEALKAIYEVDDNVPSMSLFTQRFSKRMIELADDVDLSVAVSAISLLKQLLRHQLIKDVSPLYDLLIDQSPSIRHAVGQLVFEQMIANSEDGDEDNDESEVQLKRLLNILKDFAKDPILSDYVIDAIWDSMKAMQDWSCLISMLLDENQELSDVDTTNLCRILCGSVKKSVGEKVVPAIENRKPTFTKAQKDAFELSRKKLTTALIKSHSKLMRKYLADKAKVRYIVEVIQFMKLDLYSLKQQEQNCIQSLGLVKDAFFKHGDWKTLQACVSTLSFCANETKADLQDNAQRVQKETIDQVISNLRSAIDHAEESEDDYSLTVNLRRLQHLQLVLPILNEGVFKDMVTLLEDYSNLEDEAVQLVLLNMFLYIVWYRKEIDHENPDEQQMATLISKRATLLTQLNTYMDSVNDSFKDGQSRCSLCCTICNIFTDLCTLFSKEKLAGTKIESLGFSPSSESIEAFWSLCRYRLALPDKSEDEDGDEEEEESDFLDQKDSLVTSAAKLVVHDIVPKDFLAAEIISHYVLHGKGIEETIKQFIALIKKNVKSQELCNLYLEALKKSYTRYLEADEDAQAESFEGCKELASRLSATFSGFARNVHRPSIIKLVKKGLDYVFAEAPERLAFLGSCLLPFCLRLPSADIRDIIQGVKDRVNDEDVDQDPTGWKPYQSFLEHLQERAAKADAPAQGRGKNARTNARGKKLFDDESENEEQESESEEEPHEEDDDTPLYQVRLSQKQKPTPRDESNTRTKRRKPVGHSVATEEQLPE